MVKRCGKSAPREAQATRHGKPHRVQDQIGNPGAARSTSAKADGFRVLVAQTNDSLRRKAQTKFGLQPFQNHFLTDLRSYRSQLIIGAEKFNLGAACANNPASFWRASPPQSRCDLALPSKPPNKGTLLKERAELEDAAVKTVEDPDEFHPRGVGFPRRSDVPVRC